MLELDRRCDIWRKKTLHIHQNNLLILLGSVPICAARSFLKSPTVSSGRAFTRTFLPTLEKRKKKQIALINIGFEPKHMAMPSSLFIKTFAKQQFRDTYRSLQTTSIICGRIYIHIYVYEGLFSVQEELVIWKQKKIPRN